MIEECRLCRERKKLCNSHIIPEFLYKAIYDEKNSALLIAADSEERVKVIQKGFREYLLCDECEQLLNRNESYVDKLLFGGAIKPKVVHGSEEILLVENVDYEKVKLFELSIIWRASVSRLPFFSLVSLGPHEERVREMILSERPGKPYEYGCILTLIADKGRPFDIVDRPDVLRIDGHVAYRFVMGSFSWIFVVSSHSKGGQFAKFFLTEDGKAAIFKRDVKDLGFLRAEFEATRHRAQDVLRIAKRRQLDN